MSLTNLLLESTEKVTPLSTLTALSGFVTDKPLGAFTQFLIKRFIKAFNINMDEIAEKDLSKYKTFNDFFTRKLQDGARPIDYNCKAVSPVDGTVGEASSIKAGRLIQAKGLDYSLQALVGGNKQDSAMFEDGNFVCIYLSPSNYHRIHMPLDGSLIKTIHVPGKHFPVGQRNIHHLPDLYTKNERLVCFFSTEMGPLCVVMVGAALVGSIATPWGGTIKRRLGLKTDLFESSKYLFKRGEEIGLFKYGSTVICLWGKDCGDLSSKFVSGAKVQMGQKMIEDPSIKIE